MSGRSPGTDQLPSTRQLPATAPTESLTGTVPVSLTGTGPVLTTMPPETMPARTEPIGIEDTDLDESLETDLPWLVIVWNDPINLMSFVTYVLQKLFGYSKEKATQLMLDVHNKGRAVVSSGTRDRAELDVYRLHEHGLWATMEQSS